MCQLYGCKCLPFASPMPAVGLMQKASRCLLHVICVQFCFLMRNCCLLLPGWMESTPSVLQWLLDHRPQGFPLSTLPLWQITTSFLKLIRFSHYSNLAPFMHLLGPMVEATAALSTAYLLYLESCTANRSVVQPMCSCIIDCRFAVMVFVSITALPDVPATFQMLDDRAVQELSVCMVASFCQQQHAEHSRRQQQQQQQGRLQHQQQHRGGQSRRSRSSGAAATTGSRFSSSSTFADLALPPDHELVTVAGGQYAVALHAQVVQKNVSAKPGLDVCTMSTIEYFRLRLIKAASDNSTGVMVCETAAEPSLLTVPFTQQLLLELTALLWSAGAQGHGIHCMGLLWQCLEHAQAEDVGALVAARGPLLLQVLFLALKEGWAAQQQGLFPSETMDNLLLATMSSYLETLRECKISAGLGLGAYSRVLLHRPFHIKAHAFGAFKETDMAALRYRHLQALCGVLNC